MKYVTLFLIVVGVLIFWPNKAHSRPTADDDGNEFYTSCARPNGNGMIMWCLGYTQAISHSGDVVEALLNKKISCPTGSVTIGQMQDMMVSYLARKPAERSNQMSLVYLATMSEAFPCAAK